MLNYESAFVREGRLAPDGPGYKVLSFEQDSFASNAPVMQVDSAKKLLKLAKDGLAMLVIGDWSSVGFYGVRSGLHGKPLTIPTSANDEVVVRER